MRQEKGTTGKRGIRCGCGYIAPSPSAFFEHKKKEHRGSEPWPKHNGLRPTKSNPNRHLDPRAARAKSETAKSRHHREAQKATSERWREVTGGMSKAYVSASTPPAERARKEWSHAGKCSRCGRKDKVIFGRPDDDLWLCPECIERGRKVKRLEVLILIGQAGVPYSDAECKEIGSLCDDLGLDWSRVFHGLDRLE